MIEISFLLFMIIFLTFGTGEKPDFWKLTKISFYFIALIVDILLIYYFALKIEKSEILFPFYLSGIFVLLLIIVLSNLNSYNKKILGISLPTSWIAILILVDIYFINLILKLIKKRYQNGELKIKKKQKIKFIKEPSIRKYIIKS
jgi:hypothetical protein